MKNLNELANEIREHRTALTRCWDAEHKPPAPVAVLIAIVLLDVAEATLLRAVNVLRPWNDEP